ncbi:MAG: helix-turn-helix domain-containing protein [Peptococcaceae bacterium]|nr:MAG: helix-turn-helix domain-containing protein [Peptococcaceae bacterium]
MYCQECGTKAPDTANFCQECGRKIPKPGAEDRSRRVHTVATALQEYFQGAIGETKLREAIRRGKIPHFRIGARIILREESLDAWIAEQEQFSVAKRKHPYQLIKKSLEVI